MLIRIKGFKQATDKLFALEATSQCISSFFFRDKIHGGHFSIPMSPQSPGEQDIRGNILLLTIMNALYSIDVVSSKFVFLSVHVYVHCWMNKYSFFWYDWACFQVMAHADWLLRGLDKSVLPPLGAVRGQYAFLRTCKFWRENFLSWFKWK